MTHDFSGHARAYHQKGVILGAMTPQQSPSVVSGILGTPIHSALGLYMIAAFALVVGCASAAASFEMRSLAAPSLPLHSVALAHTNSKVLGDITTIPSSSIEAGASLTPHAAIVSPRSDSIVPAGIVTITATADSTVGVAGVRFAIDGNIYFAEDSTAPYTVTLNTANIASGAHTITAIVRDASGHSSATIPAYVLIDNPVIALAGM